MTCYQEELPTRCSSCELAKETELTLSMFFFFYLECLHGVSDMLGSANSNASEALP